MGAEQLYTGFLELIHFFNQNLQGVQYARERQRASARERQRDIADQLEMVAHMASLTDLDRKSIGLGLRAGKKIPHDAGMWAKIPHH